MFVFLFCKNKEKRKQTNQMRKITRKREVLTREYNVLTREDISNLFKNG
jgi:hypothetical protein